MTEDEAKKNWCPFANAHAQPYDTQMRTVGNDRCLGSGCMAWRPTSSGVLRNKATGVERKVQRGMIYDSSEEEIVQRENGGFCARVGKPE